MKKTFDEHLIYPSKELEKFKTKYPKMAAPRETHLNKVLKSNQTNFVKKRD
jgi:hypothetical protein